MRCFARPYRVPPRAVIRTWGIAYYLLYAIRAPEPGGTQLYVTSCPATAASARSALSESGADASPGTNAADARADSARILVGQSHLLANNGSQIAVEGQHELLDVPAGLITTD